MKILGILVAALLPSLTMAQNFNFTMEQKPLLDRSSISGFEAEQYASRLNDSLSFALQDKIMRRSDPFFVGNIDDLKDLVSTQLEKSQKNLIVNMQSFKGEPALNLRLQKVSRSEGREFLRGEITGHPGSQVKLVLYGDALSGRITFPDKQAVWLIQNINDISALYEIDVTEITYD